MEKCYVGHTKNSLDITDPSLLVQEVISNFGHYIKYKVRGAPDPHTTSTSSSKCFDAISRDQSLPTLPDRIPTRTKKDDLYNAVIDLQKVADGTPVPSQEWLRLQFWPKTKHAKSSLHYMGRLKVKFIIQQRQFRKQHPDQHYAAAVFRYQCEFALKFREFSGFVC